jgi:ferredoxin
MSERIVIDSGHIWDLLGILKDHGYQPVGPTVRDGAIVYEVLTSVADLPRGVTAEQAVASYRLLKRSDEAFFAYGVGMSSWKKFLHPPDLELYRVTKTAEGCLHAVSREEEGPRYALIGVRPCELHAIAIQDGVLSRQDNPDVFYRNRREHAFVVAVNCTQPGGTCFCASMNTGPKATSGFDLALTEILGEDRHAFLVETGSSRGEKVLRKVPRVRADGEAISFADRSMAAAAQRMGRSLDTRNIQALLYENTEHPHWERVAKRCLACGNCTLVCPTCFCTTVEDSTNLAGDVATRRRKWDSCFSLDFSYIHGGPVRSSASARYRHWMTHKFATWIDQFGTSGCVGCGRCITWCPAGIDVTEEIRRLREDNPTAERRETGHGHDRDH